MRVRLRTPWCAPALLVAAACGDDPIVPPEPEPVRTVLVHRQDTGENVLLNSDGSDAGRYDAGGQDLIPLGASAVGQALVFLDGDAIVVGTLGQPGLDTILPRPASMSLATLSDDERLVALVSYAPTRGLIVYDRASRRADTLDVGPIDPVLPPVLSPADGRVVLFGLTPTSLVITVVDRTDASRPPATDALALSRFLNRPIFGWPRWVGDEIHLAFVRVADAGPDTLLVGRILPDDPRELMMEQYRAVMAPVSDSRPELAIGDVSSYALTADARALALGAIPETGTVRHAIYLMTPAVERVQLVRDDPGQFLAFPLFIRR